jgi:hypothetical protein
MVAHASRLQLRPIQRSLLGHRHTDYAHFVQLHAPLLPDAGELVSLGDKFTVSLGGHATHAVLLMDKSGVDPLTIEKSLSLSALLAYVTDSPVVPMDPRRSKRPPKSMREFASAFRGTSLRSPADYLRIVSAQADLIDDFLDIRSDLWAQREFPRGAWDDNRWVYIDLPANPQLWRAFSAYSAGMLSVLAPSRLLNFWRALEAVTTKHTRKSMFDDLVARYARPVWSRRTVSGHQRRKTFSHFNATARLRKRALRRWHHLVTAYGSAGAALDHLFWDKRGKAAHADITSLEFEGA